MRPFGGVEVLPVHGNGTAVMGRELVADTPQLGNHGAVLSLPVAPVADHAAATVGDAQRRVDAERDAEFVLAQTHDEWLLRQKRGALGGRLRRAPPWGAGTQTGKQDRNLLQVCA